MELHGQGTKDTQLVARWTKQRWREGGPATCHLSSLQDLTTGKRSVTVQGILVRVLDKNKLVQEAACSALATFAEEAGPDLVPHLPVGGDARSPSFCLHACCQTHSDSCSHFLADSGFSTSFSIIREDSPSFCLVHASITNGFMLKLDSYALSGSHTKYGV